MQLFSATNRAFLGFASSAALSSNNSHVQLWNPVGSDVLVGMRGVVFTVDVVAAVTLRHSTAALTTLIGPGQSHLFSFGAGGAAELRSQTNGSLLGTELSRARIGADSRHDFIYAEDELLLPEGFGVILAPAAQNTAAFASFKWREYPA
jgi:hypothetical protein